MTAVTVAAETAAFTAALVSLAAFAESRPELIDGLLRLIEAPDQLARFEVLPARAGEIRVQVQLAKRLRDLLAALAAGESYALLVKHGHIPGPTAIGACGRDEVES